MKSLIIATLILSASSVANAEWAGDFEQYDATAGFTAATFQSGSIAGTSVAYTDWAGDFEQYTSSVMLNVPADRMAIPTAVGDNPHDDIWNQGG